MWFHSDGRINDIFGDLIEIGVKVINSQTKVVGLDWVAANYAARSPSAPISTASRSCLLVRRQGCERRYRASSRPAARPRAASSPAAKLAPMCRWTISGQCTRPFASTVVMTARSRQPDEHLRPAGARCRTWQSRFPAARRPRYCAPAGRHSLRPAGRCRFARPDMLADLVGRTAGEYEMRVATAAPEGQFAAEITLQPRRSIPVPGFARG